jgi:hypothetical protein
MSKPHNITVQERDCTIYCSCGWKWKTDSQAQFYAEFENRIDEHMEPVYNPIITQSSIQPYPLVQHIDADRTRGASDWDRECQESGRLNRGGI